MSKRRLDSAKKTKPNTKCLRWAQVRLQKLLALLNQFHFPSNFTEVSKIFTFSFNDCQRSFGLLKFSRKLFF